MRIHKTGSISAGASLILFGCAFFAHTFFGVMNYTLILKFWPLILVSLGIEILLNRNEENFVFDKGSVFLFLIVLLFAFAMAGADLFLSHIHPV